MAYREDGYYYNSQLKTYLLQFMAIFTGLQVQAGITDSDDAPRMIEVPIAYAHKDRIVASLLADNTHNKPIRLPTMSAYLQRLSIDQSRLTGVGTERRNTFTPVGGLAPDDTVVVHQRKPIPYVMSVELGIYASNTDQHFQMLEQIIPLFDPALVIQTNDAIFDMTRMTRVTLTDVSMNTNMPIGADKRIIQSTLTFDIPIWLSIPSEVRDDFIRKIFMRIGTVSTAAETNYEMIAELDAQNIPYTLVQDITDFSV